METREREFLEYVQSGGQVETDDWMPDEYRAKLIKFIEMHGNSELMGVLPEREWILRAPTLQRKLALTAKVQDEVGHAQLIYRVVEDLGKPREQCLADLISGKSKFHNVFHYPTKTWGDVGVEGPLLDAHRTGQVLHRRAVVALLCKEPGRLARQLVSPRRHLGYPTDR